MTTLIVWAVIIAILAGTLWMARKAGKDEVRADAAEKAIAKATEANRPVTDAERARVVQLFKRP